MQTTLVQRLNEEFQKRRSKNDRYSLRSYAKTLGVSSSFLSKVMRGQKGLSRDTLFKVGSRLKISARDLDALAVQLNDFKPQSLGFKQLALDEFQFISDWQYFAILELTTLSDFELTESYIARRLRLTLPQVSEAIKRLKRLGIIEADSNGELAKPVENYSTTHLENPGIACREHERQVLNLAVEALDTVPISERDQTSLTLAIPAARFEEARAKISAFRREMADLLQRPGDRDSVYHLSISFYPVTKPHKKENL